MVWTRYDVTMIRTSIVKVYEASCNPHTAARFVTTLFTRPKRNSCSSAKPSEGFLLLSRRPVFFRPKT